MYRCAQLAAGLVLVAKAAAQTSLYPAVDPVLLANAFNISIGCLDALNETVTCDDTLFGMAGSVDNYLWDINNVTALCTPSCLSTASTWFTDVSTECANDLMNINGKLVTPTTIPGRVLDGMNIACLTPTTNVLLDPGINGSLITSTLTSQSNSTVTLDPTAYTSDAVAPLKRSKKRQTTSSTGYCLIDSYSWVGSDIIRPDCTLSTNANASQCLDPTDVPADNERIANLYPDTLLCSDCFLKMFYLRVASPYLPDLDYSDYLVTQYFDIVDVCEAEMPDLLVRMNPYYDDVPGVYDGTPITDNSTINATVECDQTIDLPRLLNLVIPDPDGNGTVYCDAMSLAYNVTTSDLQVAFDDPFCNPTTNFTSACVPAGCTVSLVPANATCDSFVESISTVANNITTTQFITWNPNLLGFCDQLQLQYACISAPGGSYVSPPASNATSSDSGQQRGGGDGTGTSTGSGTAVGGGRNATTIPLGGTAPSPVQSGISPSCTAYAEALANDGCYSLTTLWGISEADFFKWNAVLGTNGVNCTTQLFEGYYYCIDVQSTATTTVKTSTSSSTSLPTPSPVQTGIDPQCTAYAEAKSGGSCSAFAASNGITVAQLALWNPVLGVAGATCQTAFEANVYYCVAAPSASSATTISSTRTTSTSTSLPTQTGIISSCNKYAEPTSGTGCYDFATANSITPTELYAWNTILGVAGANCAAEFFAGTDYCVGISGNCNAYAVPMSGTGCSDFATANGITAAQLYAWNPTLGAGGANCGTAFFANTYYCIGVTA